MKTTLFAIGAKYSDGRGNVRRITRLFGPDGSIHPKGRVEFFVVATRPKSPLKPGSSGGCDYMTFSQWAVKLLQEVEA